MSSNSNKSDDSQSKSSSNENGSMMLRKKRPKVLGKRQIKSSSKQDTEKNESKKAEIKFLYKPFVPLPDLSDYLGSLIEVRIGVEYLSQSNKAFIEKRIWGSDIYTSDSDIVCILQHSGNFIIKELAPTNLEGVSLFLRVLKGRSIYNTALKNNIKSKKLTNFNGHSIKPEKYSILKNGLGSKQELEEMASRMPNVIEIPRKKANSNKIMEVSFHRNNNLVFNMCFEPSQAYSIPTIADKGREVKEFLSYRLKDSVLYIETSFKRYEVSKNPCDYSNDDFLFEEFETFKFAEVLKPHEKDNDFMNEAIVPLEDKFVNVIFERIDWQEIEWGESSLLVKNFDIQDVKSFKYYNCNSQGKKM